MTPPVRYGNSRSCVAAAAAARLNALFADNLYFVPVRHHSPACARATQALISEIRPVAVLIEGPESFSGLIPLLLDTQTRPPVAILCQTPARPAAAMDGGGASPGTAFFSVLRIQPGMGGVARGRGRGRHAGVY